MECLLLNNFTLRFNLIKINHKIIQIVSCFQSLFYVIGSKLIFCVVLEAKEMLRRHFREWKIIVLADSVDLCAFTICNIGMDTSQYYETKRERIMY